MNSTISNSALVTLADALKKFKLEREIKADIARRAGIVFGESGREAVELVENAAYQQHTQEQG